MPFIFMALLNFLLFSWSQKDFEFWSSVDPTLINDSQRKHGWKDGRIELVNQTEPQFCKIASSIGLL